MLRGIREFFYRNQVPLENFKVLQNILSEHYTLGTFIRCRRIHTGYVNVSYELEMFRNGKPRRYLLRCYRMGTRGKKIRFEHALLRQLFKRQFVFSPRVIDTKYGKTYVKLEQKPKRGIQQTYYLAVFSFLQGEDTYRWDAPLCTDEELADAAKVFALYHNTVFGWETEETCKKLLFVDYIPSIMEQWSSYTQTTVRSAFDLYFLEQFDDLLRCLKSSLTFPGQGKYNAMPRLIIHGDYHPGNLKFQNGKVAGVFDFDWAKMETRCFDISLAINYFCTSWEETKDGELLVDRVETFLGAYLEAAKEMEGLGSLNNLELECLPAVMMMSNLAIMDWTVNDFYKTRPDPEEYQTYLRHSVRLLQWLERNRDVLAECILRYRC